MRAYWRILALIMFSAFQLAEAITLVYNMRVRRTFAVAGRLRQESSSIWVPSIVPIYQYRSRHIVNNTFTPTDVTDIRSIGGAILNFQVIPSRNYWAEITTGVEREHASIRGTTNKSTARSGVDDIVLDAGYNFYPIEHGQLSFYGLVGLPSRLKVSKIEQFGTFVGTRFFTLGGGAEISYGFIDTLQRSLDLIAQARFLHFFNRSWEPILPAGANIQPGNVTDFLLTLQYREKRDIFEIGYNPTWFTNQGVLLKTGPVMTDTFVRNGAFVSYSHLFKSGSLIKKPLLIGGGLNYSYAKFFNTKTVSCWVSLSWVF